MSFVTLPELGEGIEKATVACWHYKVGDRVTRDDDVVEVVTDKAVFNVVAGASGILRGSWPGTVRKSRSAKRSRRSNE